MRALANTFMSTLVAMPRRSGLQRIATIALAVGGSSEEAVADTG